MATRPRSERIVFHVFGWFFFIIGVAGWIYVFTTGDVFGALQLSTDFPPDKVQKQLTALSIAVFGFLTLVGVALLRPAFGGLKSWPFRILFIIYVPVAVAMLAIFINLMNG